MNNSLSYSTIFAMSVIMIFSLLSSSCRDSKQAEEKPSLNAAKSVPRSKSDLVNNIRKQEIRAEQAKSAYEEELSKLNASRASLAAMAFLNTQDAALFTEPNPSGIIKVYNSTFNELVDAIEPITKSGSHPLRKTVTVCIPWTDYCYSKTITICGGNYSAEVKNTTFSINTETINISGNVTGTYNCKVNLDFNADLNTTGNASYNSTTNRINVTTNPTSIEPCLHVPVVDRNVCLGFTVNVAPTFNYSIPVTTASLYFETEAGQRRIRITPQSVTLSKKNGYIQISSDVILW